MNPHISARDSSPQHFGPVEEVLVKKDPNPRTPGQAYVTFTEVAHGTAATQMGGVKIMELPITVKVWSYLPRKGPPGEGVIGGQRDLDLVAHDTITIGKQQQAALMAARAAEAGIAVLQTTPQPATQPAAPPPHPMRHLQGLLGPASPIPTESLLIKNMFDPNDEQGAEWDIEIAEDVREECQAKYGPVEHVFVDRNSPGFVYVRFKTVPACKLAQEGLQDRNFGGRRLFTEFAFSATYKNHFKL